MGFADVQDSSVLWGFSVRFCFVCLFFLYPSQGMLWSMVISDWENQSSLCMVFGVYHLVMKHVKVF